MKSSDIRLLGKRILIKPLDLPSLSSLIYAPDPTRTFLGEVMAVGEKVDVKVGDKIVYCNVQRFEPYKFEEGICHIIYEADVGGVLGGEQTCTTESLKTI